MSANCLHTTLMTCSVLTLAGGLTGAECQVDWIPPHKVNFQADLSVKSLLALEGATPTGNRDLRTLRHGSVRPQLTTLPPPGFPGRFGHVAALLEEKTSD